MEKLNNYFFLKQAVLLKFYIVLTSLFSLIHVGKTEKLVYQCLSDLGLPSGKNESVPKADFTFDKFYELYHKICPRNDIEELFRFM